MNFPNADRPSADRPSADRPSADRPSADRPSADRPSADQEQPGDAPAAGRVVSGAAPLLPEQSREDTDAGWGEYPERSDDRLYRDRPPHWNDF
jgi:hypothetical protein